MDWMKREEARFESGLYKQIPWYVSKRLKPIPEHYAHISQNEDSLIAFTESRERGERNLKTVLRPGRYLARFYPELDANQVRELAREVIGTINVLFTSDPDEIEAVYENGPDSCMAGDSGKFEYGIHPVRAYGNSDLQLAYIKRGARYVARGVVWPEKKRFASLYGDSDALETALTNLGYSYGSFIGAKLSMIKIKKHLYVCPFLDSGGYVIPDQTANALVITDGNQGYVSDQDGYVKIECCFVCDKPTPYGCEEVQISGEWQSVCKNCLHDEAGIFYMDVVYHSWHSKYDDPPFQHPVFHGGKLKYVEGIMSTSNVGQSYCTLTKRYWVECTHIYIDNQRYFVPREAFKRNILGYRNISMDDLIRAYKELNIELAEGIGK